MVARLSRLIDRFGVGDLVSVFYVSELGSPNRVVGTCVAKLRAFDRFKVVTVSGVVYSFDYKSPNIVSIKKLPRL
jgi:hypothetical protein